MKSGSTILITFIGLGILIFFGWLGIYAYKQPQGPALESTPEMVFVTTAPQVASTPTSTLVPTAILVPQTPTATQQPTVVPVSVCGETSAWNILILGSDYGVDGPIKGSELTLFLRADFPNRKVIIYALPGDLWIDAQGLGLSNPNIDATRLAAVFYEARIRSPQFAELDTMVDGTRATARMLYKNFSLTTEHYVAIDLKHIPALIEAAGGLPINIPERTTDPYIGIVIPAGQQTLNGNQVLAYARAIPDTGFGRLRRNQLLLEAMRQRLLSPAIFVKIPALYTQFKRVIATDLSLEQINHLACLVKEAPAGAIIQDNVRPEWTSPGHNGSLLWNKDNVFNQLKSLGLIP